MMIRALINGVLLWIGNAIPNASDFHRFRPFFYRCAGLKIGTRTVIVGPLSFPVDNLGIIEIGDDTYLNAETRFGPNGSRIRIGNHCLVGPRVSFETGSHGLRCDEKGSRGHSRGEIVIGDGVWIGAGAIILQGVTIGTRAVVTAGAVVTKDVSPMTMVGGVPARLIRRIDEAGEPRRG
jgi:maltose O-acetyltransferase